MIFTIYNRHLEVLGRYKQSESPKLSQLKVANPVIAFDQSTTCTGITVGDSKGNIHGFIRLTKEDSHENGTIFIANFQVWLQRFIDIEPDFLLYENTFSKQYYRTDVILSQLRGVFTTLKSQNNWQFPMEIVNQQDWKSNLMRLKSGNRSLTKDNAHDVILDILYPNLKYSDNYSDVYDSIGIYYYYKCHFMNRDLSEPVDISKSLKIKEGIDIEYSFIIGKEPELSRYSRIASNRGIRYFNYNRKMTPREHIQRLASNSNELWICHVPYNNNPFIDVIMSQCPRLPMKDENIYLVGYRVKSKKFQKRIL